VLTYTARMGLKSAFTSAVGSSSTDFVYILSERDWKVKKAKWICWFLELLPIIYFPIVDNTGKIDSCERIGDNNGKT
jgi:hypothetical protein